MFSTGDVIDKKYRVTSLCSNSGGMGTILFVEPVQKKAAFPLVLKYCKDQQDEFIKRFRREVRILAEHSDSPKIATVIDHNVRHDPPYYVMKYYADGDLQKRAPAIRKSKTETERVF